MEITTPIINDFSFSVATVNGSGSQSANLVLTKSFFRMGLPVAAKNIFPSNISGLPTWFSIRVNLNGFVGRRLKHDILIAKNLQTAEQDIHAVTAEGFYFYDQDFKIDPTQWRSDVVCVPLPFREIVQSASDSIKTRKFLTNMVYVGVLAELLHIDLKILRNVIQNRFADNTSIIDANLKVLESSRSYANEHLNHMNIRHRAEQIENGAQNKILIDGNSAAALGAISGGCTVFSWYPITPATSIAESFSEHVQKLRPKSENQKNSYAIVQTEDELSAINITIGAGWAGSRAMTVTSGPGLSLMAEAAGLSYFAEIPAVIWDVQRAGPSTGLPTRTLQGDVQFASHLSHGDTEHIILIPGNPEECFQFAQLAFDLADQLQTLVIVLSDLDLGMNLSISEDLKPNLTPYRRGKILSAEALNSVEEFSRYRDIDGDGVPYRTLPGTLHAKAAFFTRGTSHNEKAGYSEDGTTYSKLLLRLRNKFKTALDMLPASLLQTSSQCSIGILAYGSSDQVMPEVLADLKRANIYCNYIRLRALPINKNLKAQMQKLNRLYIVEQNRDGQMCNLLIQKFSEEAHKFISVTSFDGLPLSAENVIKPILASEQANLL